MKRGPFYDEHGFFVQPVHFTIRNRRTREAANTAVHALTEVIHEAERADELIDSLVKRARDDAGREEPTYVSGSSDKVYAVSDMPTRYLVNCVNMSDERLARGVRRELEAELKRRNDRAGGE